MAMVDKLAAIIHYHIIVIQGGIILCEAKLLIDAGQGKGDQGALLLGKLAGHHAD